MAMDAAEPVTLAGRLEAMQRENEQLREQIRRLSAQQTVARGAILEAAHEKEATERLVHQVAVEERATRAAVEVQSGNLGISVVLQIVNFFLLVVTVFSLLVWLPKELENRIRPDATIVTPAPAGGPVIIPGQ